MVFIILDEEKKKYFNSEDYEKIEEIQEEVGYHPAYNCELLLDDGGDLYITNGCGDLRGVPSRYKFSEFIRDGED
jgi:hypothetical protein